MWGFCGLVCLRFFLGGGVFSFLFVCFLIQEVIFFSFFFTCILSACRARDFGVYFKKVLKISASDYDSLV